MKNPFNKNYNNLTVIVALSPGIFFYPVLHLLLVSQKGLTINVTQVEMKLDLGGKAEQVCDAAFWEENMWLHPLGFSRLFLPVMAQGTRLRHHYFHLAFLSHHVSPTTGSVVPITLANQTDMLSFIRGGSRIFLRRGCTIKENRFFFFAEKTSCIPARDFTTVVLFG